MNRYVTLLAVISLVILYGWGHQSRDLWTPDEPRVAQIGHEVAAGRWIIPTLGGEVFLETPPLHAWMMAGFYALWGDSPATAPRFLSALFAFGGLVLTYQLCRELFAAGGDPARAPSREPGGPRRWAHGVGVAACLVLGLSAEFFTTGHRIVVDGVLVFFSTAAVLGFVRYVRGGSWRRVALGAALVSAALAFLTKGLLGLAAPGLFLLAWAARAGTARVLVAPLLCGPPVFALVAGPWLCLATVELGAEAWERLFVDNTWGRIVSTGGRGHERPFWYHLVYFPVYSLPASLFFAGGLWRRWRGTLALDEKASFAFDVALWWFVAGFVMLSLAGTKRAVYLLPFYPGMAVVAGVWLQGYVCGRYDGPFERALAALLALTLFAAAVSVPIGVYILDGEWRAPSIALAAAGALFAAGVLLSAYLQRSRHRPVSMFVAGLVVLVVGATYTIIPCLDRLKSLAGVTQRIARLVPEEQPIYLLDPDETTRAMFPLYASRRAVPLYSREATDRALKREGEIFIVTVDKTHRRVHRRFVALQPLAPQVLLEELRPRSRAFRLLKIEADVQRER